MDAWITISLDNLPRRRQAFCTIKLICLRLETKSWWLLHRIWYRLIKSRMIAINVNFLLKRWRRETWGRWIAQRDLWRIRNAMMQMKSFDLRTIITKTALNQFNQNNQSSSQRKMKTTRIIKQWVWIKIMRCRLMSAYLIKLMRLPKSQELLVSKK